jgi:glycosyltransferase involved in cell wall biosynthesis
MISILIPTYNYDVTKLVTDLHNQASKEVDEFEIIVMEDGKTPLSLTNSSIGKLSNCQHIILEQNIGRSAIRNKLASTAKYDHLLFMDCDAQVCSTTYISKYLPFCNEECVVIGGTAYDPNESTPAYSLRLKYGRNREAMNAYERSKNRKIQNFAAFNFLVSKSLFEKAKFDETIKGYGHEDTLFGHELHELGLIFNHIDNPLIHKGLDDNTTYLKKTEIASLNLLKLYETGRYPFLQNESKLLSAYVKVKNLGMTHLISILLSLSEKWIVANLRSANPSLRLFDLYKLMFICKVSANKMTT